MWKGEVVSKQAKREWRVLASVLVSDNKREDKDKSQGEGMSKSRDGVEGEVPALSPSAEAQC